MIDTRLTQSFTGFVLEVGRRYAPQIAGLVTVLLAAALLSGANIALIVPFIDLVNSTSESNSDNFVTRIVYSAHDLFGVNPSLVTILFAFLSLLLMQGAVAQYGQRLTVRLHIMFGRELFAGLSDAYLNATLSYHRNAKVGQLVNTMTVECTTAANCVTLFAYMLREFVLLSTFILIAVSVSWELTLVIVGLGALSTVSIRGLHLRAERFGHELVNRNATLQSEVNEKLSAIRDVKSGHTERFVNSIFLRILDERLHFRYESMLNAALVANMQLIIGGLILAVLLVLATSVFQLELGLLALFLVSTRRLLPHFSGVQRWYNEVSLSLPSLWTIVTSVENAELEREVAQEGQIAIARLAGDIVFDRVSFSYEDENRSFYLRDLSMTIKDHSITSILGKSGSGKSTIVDMLLGFNVPQAGEIRLADRRITDFTVASVRRRIGFVAQGSVLFNDTIGRNIAWYKPNADEGEIRHAATVANICELIDELPEGLDTIVGDRGVKLSGGQVQRVILARSVMTDPDLLILDEATSNLDPHSESLILQSVRELARSRKVVMISHNAGPVEISDYVYKLVDGTLQPIAAHEALRDS